MYIVKLKQEERRKTIYELYLENRSNGKKFTSIKANKTPKRIVLYIIKRAKNDFSRERIKQSGRKVMKDD